MDAVQRLRDASLKVKVADVGSARSDVGLDAVLTVTAGEHDTRFAVEVKGRAPYPNELERLQPTRRKLSLLGHPLLVVPFVSESLGIMLTDAGWSWADGHGNFDLRAPGLLLRQRRAMDVPTRTGKTLPRGTGSFAIIRALVHTDDTAQIPGATALATSAKVSQPRASQVLRQLHELGLIERAGHGRWIPDKGALADRFLAEYPGPGGSEQYFYTLDPLLDVAIHASEASRPGRPVVVSADVGPDLIQPWRRPSHLILYAPRTLDPASLGLVSAQAQHDANVIVRTPDDESVFPRPGLLAQALGHELLLADPLQQVWDLQHLGGADRMEAAGRLREWLLERH